MGLGSIASAFGGAIANPMVATGALGGASSALSYIGQKKTNEMSRDMSRENMRFQERMSSTAYQRGMKDMKKAGLNPILAGKLGGASTPGGAMPQFHSALGAGVQGFQSGVSSANDVRRTSADTAFKNAQTVLTENLQPGSEALSTMAGAMRDVVEHIDSTLRDQSTMSEAIEATGLWFDAFVAKVRSTGMDVDSFLSKTFDGLSGSAKSLLMKVKEKFNNSDISYERK